MKLSWLSQINLKFKSVKREPSEKKSRKEPLRGSAGRLPGLQDVGRVRGAPSLGSDQPHSRLKERAAPFSAFSETSRFPLRRPSPPSGNRFGLALILGHKLFYFQPADIRAAINKIVSVRCSWRVICGFRRCRFIQLSAVSLQHLEKIKVTSSWRKPAVL